MRQLLEMLPKLLGAMPEIVKYIKYIPILMLLGGIGYGAYYVTQNYRDPYMCYNNHLYVQKSVISNVYTFVGDICVSGSKNENQSDTAEN